MDCDDGEWRFYYGDHRYFDEMNCHSLSRNCFPLELSFEGLMSGRMARLDLDGEVGHLLDG